MKAKTPKRKISKEEKMLAVLVTIGVLCLCGGPLIYMFLWGESYWPIAGIAGVTMYHIGVVMVFGMIINAVDPSWSNKTILAAILVWALMGGLFWRPVANLVTGALTVQGNLEFQFSKKVYIKTTTSRVNENIIEHYDIVTQNGERYRIKETPGRANKWKEQILKCDKKTYITFLPYRGLRNILSVSCTEPEAK